MAIVRVKVEKSEFKNLPDGRYEGFLSDPEIVPPKEEGKFPYLKVQFRTDDPELGEKNITDIYSFSPKASFRLVALLETLQVAFEIEKDESDGSETVAFDPEHLAGKSVLAQITTETSKSPKNGKTYTNNKVSQYFLPV